MTRSITVNLSSPDIINMTGRWTFNKYLKVSYSWSNAPSGMKSTVPSDEYYHSGDNVTIDTTYNNKSGYKEEKWSVSEATMPTSSNWSNLCYGNGKYVANGYDTETAAYSTDGVNWIQADMPSSGYWESVCYGNGKFVAIEGNGQRNGFAYSTNGINWTKGTLPSSQSWHSVCYGNGKFVAVGWRTNIFIYSSDGINWTKGTLPSIQNWECVCYGNDKFVTIARESNKSAYSTDGINWTEGTMPSNQTWASVCYGDGKFVALSYSAIFNYSTDGINWAEDTLSNSTNGDICYGNGKFIINRTGSSLYYLIYSPIYYQFSGWNKSDFNITADTSVGGSWSQVSAGGGTNLSELSVGDTFLFGKYQVESETPWDIEWEIVHQTADYQIAMTKQIIDLRPFDGKESTNPDSDRKDYGNNNWSISNIEQWMNSYQASWYSAQHTYDAPPNDDNCSQYTKDGTTVTNAYDTHKGFLYYWSADEKALLRDMTLTLANNTVTDGGGSYTWTGKVWLPTYTQMGGGQNNSISEGEAFSKFTDNSSRIKSLHPNCIANNEYAKVKNSSGNWYYWMSSANPSTSNNVRFVYSAGSIGVSNLAYYCYIGFAPCICLPRTGWSDPNKAPDLNYIT